MPAIRELKSNYIIGWIKKWMSDAGMEEQQQLADAIGISPQLISHKFRKNAFSIKELIDIIDVLDVPDEEIVKAMRKKARKK